MTWAEYEQQLKAEGKWEEYIARKKERGEYFQRKAREYALTEAPVVQALNAVGVPVRSVWDLVNAGRKRPSRPFRISTDPPEAFWDWLESQGGSYAAIVPLLLDHLQRPYPDEVRGGIARALGVREARFAWPLLVKLYRQERSYWTRDAMAVALGNLADDECLDELIALAKDRQNGPSRALLLDALRRSRSPKAQQTLMELGTDPEIGQAAQQVLAIIKRRRKSR